MVAPVPPTLTKVVKSRWRDIGQGSPAVVASTFAARYWRKMGAPPARPWMLSHDSTDQSQGDQEGVTRIPGRCSAQTKGLNAACTRR